MPYRGRVLLDLSGPFLRLRSGRCWLMTLFRMAHRDSDGSCLLDGRMAALAMAAALLGELTLTGRLSVEGGLVRVLDRRAPADVVARGVLGQIVKEPVEHSVRTWLAHLGENAYVEVARRMVGAGHVEERASRRWLGRKVRYVPTDMNAAAWPWARMTDALRRVQPLPLFDVLLGGLAVAVDLHRSALVGEANSFTIAMKWQLTSAPDAVQELVALTRAAAGNAVITRT